eukprot:TRINITY_DN6097_c0_g1_i1.p1 TRINITY_DN6097_c0_g1~~TRINITY_DN6097_c0_g1_i1.p1  ORF type:complete len:298 (-),score=40.51 TRINITY_DN6097_c0_g1_i1:14-907(-)
MDDNIETFSIMCENVESYFNTKKKEVEQSLPKITGLTKVNVTQMEDVLFDFHLAINEGVGLSITDVDKDGHRKQLTQQAKSAVNFVPTTGVAVQHPTQKTTTTSTNTNTNTTCTNTAPASTHNTSQISVQTNVQPRLHPGVGNHSALKGRVADPNSRNNSVHSMSHIGQNTMQRINPGNVRNVNSMNMNGNGLNTRQRPIPNQNTGNMMNTQAMNMRGPMNLRMGPFQNNNMGMNRYNQPNVPYTGIRTVPQMGRPGMANQNYANMNPRQMNYTGQKRNMPNSYYNVNPANKRPRGN